MPKYKSVDALQNALATTMFARTESAKKAAGRALGTFVELITFYMLRDWGLELNLAIERGLREYGNAHIVHNVEFTLHVSDYAGGVAVPDDASTITPTVISRKMIAPVLGSAVLATGRALRRNGLVRHALTFAEDSVGFWNAYLVTPDDCAVVHLARQPFAMFECKRVGVEEGQKKGPQTIEKAKQGAYVARTVSGIQRVTKRTGEVAAIIENIDGSLSVHDDYYTFIDDALRAGDQLALKNLVLTVGVVSNHGNWFTAENHNKEIRVLAQSYDWLLFLTDSALAEFIETTLQGTDARFLATRKAFAASYETSGGKNRFTKVEIDAGADQELTEYFSDIRPWDRWFNVITPEAELHTLSDDLIRLSEILKPEV